MGQDGARWGKMGQAVVSLRTEVERQRERAKRKGVGARRLHKSESQGAPADTTPAGLAR